MIPIGNGKVLVNRQNVIKKKSTQFLLFHQNVANHNFKFTWAWNKNILNYPFVQEQPPSPLLMFSLLVSLW